MRGLDGDAGLENRLVFSSEEFEMLYPKGSIKGLKKMYA